jgi:MftR C-terminal domain
LPERPTSEPLREALINAVLQHYQGTDQSLGHASMAAIRLVVGSPAIRGEYLKINAEMQDALAAVIGERTRHRSRNRYVPADSRGRGYRGDTGRHPALVPR